MIIKVPKDLHLSENKKKALEKNLEKRRAEMQQAANQSMELGQTTPLQQEVNSKESKQQPKLTLIEVQTQQAHVQEAVKALMNKHIKLWTYMFQKYQSTPNSHSNSKQRLNLMQADQQESIKVIQVADICKSLQDYDIFPQLISKEEVSTLVSLINIKLANKNGAQSLTFQGFLNLMMQVAFVCFRKPAVNDQLSLDESIKALIKHCEQAALKKNLPMTAFQDSERKPVQRILKTPVKLNNRLNNSMVINDISQTNTNQKKTHVNISTYMAEMERQLPNLADVPQRNQAQSFKSQQAHTLEVKPIINLTLRREVMKYPNIERPHWLNVAEILEEMLQAVEFGRSSLGPREKSSVPGQTWQDCSPGLSMSMMAADRVGDGYRSNIKAKEIQLQNEYKKLKELQDISGYKKGSRAERERIESLAKRKQQEEIKHQSDMVRKSIENHRRIAHDENLRRKSQEELRYREDEERRKKERIEVMRRQRQKNEDDFMNRRKQSLMQSQERVTTVKLQSQFTHTSILEQTRSQSKEYDEKQQVLGFILQPDVQSIFGFYDKQLRQIFRFYASQGKQENSDKLIALKEFTKFTVQQGLTPNILTQEEASFVFRAVQMERLEELALSMYEGHHPVDRNIALALDFEYFKRALVRLVAQAQENLGGTINEDKLAQSIKLNQLLVQQQQRESSLDSSSRSSLDARRQRGNNTSLSRAMYIKTDDDDSVVRKQTTNDSIAEKSLQLLELLETNKSALQSKGLTLIGSPLSKPIQAQFTSIRNSVAAAGGRSSVAKKASSHLRRSLNMGNVTSSKFNPIRSPAPRGLNLSNINAKTIDSFLRNLRLETNETNYIRYTAHPKFVEPRKMSFYNTRDQSGVAKSKFKVLANIDIELRNVYHPPQALNKSQL